MPGKARNIYINSEIVHQPWFINLKPIQRFMYLWAHINCSPIGVYLHSESRIEYDLGEKISESDLIDWYPNRIKKLPFENAFLLTRFLEEENRRGTRIKPISGPDLGKVREAIQTGMLNELINTGIFHRECKLFEYGINEGIIENKSYSIRKKKGESVSRYEQMINKVQDHISKQLSAGNNSLPEGLGKPMINLNSNSESNLIADSGANVHHVRHESSCNRCEEIARQLDITDNESLDEVTKKIYALAKDVEKAGITGDSYNLIASCTQILKDEIGNSGLITFMRLKNEIFESYGVA